MNKPMPDSHYEEASQIELGLLGAVLLAPNEIDELPEAIGSKFNDRELGRALDFIVTLHLGGVAVYDINRVVSELRKAGLLDGIGGAATIAKAASRSLAHNAPWYSQRIRELHALRALAEIGEVLSEESRSEMAIADSLKEIAETRLCALDDTDSDEICTIGEMVTDEIARLQEAVRTGKKLGISCGIESLDGATGGLFPGEMTIVGARPSIGKTALGMELTARMVEMGSKVLFVSLEMTKSQLAHRFLARETGLSVKEIQCADLGHNQIARLLEAKHKLKNLPFRAFCVSSATVRRIHSRARLMNAREGLDAVVVDYLGLIDMPGRMSQYERITAISRDLKKVALSLNVPLLVLSQLNRESEKGGRLPTLADIRDSGAIEQDADNVWLLHRESRATPEAKLIIAKQRQGAVGTIELEFDAARMKFIDKPPVNYEPAFSGWSGGL
jgi:replicative DNA helicase